MFGEIEIVDFTRKGCRGLSSMHENPFLTGGNASKRQERGEEATLKIYNLALGCWQRIRPFEGGKPP